MKLQRKAVHAIAQAGRLRPIVEDVTEMTAAAAAVNFGPQHPKSTVFGLADRVFERLVKARPAGAAATAVIEGDIASAVPIWKNASHQALNKKAPVRGPGHNCRAGQHLPGQNRCQVADGAAG